MKNSIRKQILSARNELPYDIRQEYNKIIVQKLLQSIQYQQAKRVFCYVSVDSEVDTRELIYQAWKDKKYVSVPVTKKGGLMYFIDIPNMHVLHQTKLGLWEPQAEKERERIPDKSDLFLVPGVAFDRNCGRLGYGGGFYDRYFEKHMNFYKLGLSYEVQLVKEVPKEVFDISLDGIVTEKNWLGGGMCE